jgi:WD40 repeat protein
MFGVSSAMFNDSGTQLLTCLDQGIQIWDFAETANGRELKGPRLLESRVGSSRVLTHTFASDRAVIVSSDQAVWKFSRGDFLNPVKLPSRFEQSAAISPNGRWLAESSYYAPIYLYDLEKNQTLQNLAPQGGLLAFSPDGRWLTVGRGGSVETWDATTWTRTWKISTRTVRPSTGHCVFRPQGDLLATLDDAEHILLLRPADGKRILRLVSSRPAPINRICFSDSGKTLLASTEEGRVQIWRLDKLDHQLAEMGLDWNKLIAMPRISDSN